MGNVKAVVCLSGGLDSAIAVKLLMKQGIECIAVKFTSPFCTCDQKGVCFSKKLADDLQISYKAIPKGPDYLDIIRSPKHGYGQGVNPCIDCRIFMFKKAKEFMDEVGAKFIVTGEVLGQRPMSQHRKAMDLIEKEAGLEGLILRPLSASLLDETIPEREGWVDRSQLLSIQGRSRKEQLLLTDELEIKDFACAAGGCLLTDPNFSLKVKDLIKHQDTLTFNDIFVLKAGRHFRYNENKIITGRNKEDNEKLLRLKSDADYLIEPKNIMGPSTILQGPKTDDAVLMAARITAYYCKNVTKPEEFVVSNIDEKTIIEAMPVLNDQIDDLIITNRTVIKTTV